ncbi:MAG: COX15/CtaA family protein [Dehalococcoidia bacterium]
MAPIEPSPAATGASTAAPTAFQWLAFATCAVVYGLIVLGGVVRVTGSGDACPDWPRCHGELLPPLERDVLIEFSHRLVASVVGFMVLAVAISGWRLSPATTNRSVIRWGGVAAVGLVIVQIGLGGATVLNDLDADLVTAHLAAASALLATLLVIALLSLPRPDSERAVSRSFRNLTVVAALAVLALMLSGSYVTGSGASLAFRDWPLFDGQLLPEGGHRAMAHATHRLTAAVVGLLLTYLTWRAWRDASLSIARIAMLALALYVAQVFVGAANIWTMIQPSAQASHLAVGVAVWATLVTLATLAWRATNDSVVARRTAQPAPARQRGSTDAGEPAPVGRAS